MKTWSGVFEWNNVIGKCNFILKMSLVVSLKFIYTSCEESVTTVEVREVESKSSWTFYSVIDKR